MIRIPAIIVALYASILGAFSQSPDTTRYEERRLKVDEVNLVSSYYRQEGDNAAVTGGIGSERLTDIATTIDVQLLMRDRRNRLNTFNVELGIDTYSSASSDKIDPSTISSASSKDQRIYPTISWSRADDSKGTTIGASFSVSSEYDYLSFGGGVNVYKDSKDKSRQIGIRLQTYQDLVTLIYPIEQRGDRPGGTASRNTYSASVSYAQIVNPRLQFLLMLDFAWQDGFLSLPFNRIYFSDSSVGIENLPGKRMKFPVSARASYFLGDRLVVRTYFRHYQDDWGLKSNTAEIETPVKVTPFFSISPFYRYYNQSAVDYFAGYGKHTRNEEYYTSDYDLSEFDSHLMGAGIRLVSPGGIFGISKFNTVEVRYGHYSRATGLISNIITLNAKFR